MGSIGLAFEEAAKRELSKIKSFRIVSEEVIAEAAQAVRDQALLAEAAAYYDWETFRTARDVTKTRPLFKECYIAAFEVLSKAVPVTEQEQKTASETALDGPGKEAETELPAFVVEIPVTKGLPMTGETNETQKNNNLGKKFVICLGIIIGGGLLFSLGAFYGKKKALEFKDNLKQDSPGPTK